MVREKGQYALVNMRVEGGEVMESGRVVVVVVEEGCGVFVVRLPLSSHCPKGNGGLCLPLPLPFFQIIIVVPARGSSKEEKTESC